MKLLALETSTETCSVALRVGDAVRVRRRAGARQQTEHVLPMVQELLAEAGLALRGLDAVACAHGPGAFTGVRVAVSVAQGLSFGAGVPAIGISTLAALAQQAVRTAGARHVLPLLDARMGELYAGAYVAGDDGLVDAMVPDRLCRPEDYAAGVPAGPVWTGIGSGWQAFAADALGVLPRQVLVAEPDAEDVLALAVRAFSCGEAVTAEQLIPVYLRDTVAWKKIGEQGKP
ncbi:MAG: tRNA (adenosine(37)-N6)-threonylcarbamoyltransferase complex dimerization subunit type 1 TsaB [Pseudomonadota bacterium]